MTSSRIDSQLRGFSLAAARVAGWTSNLLVTAVVLLVGVTFGRQLTSWWAWDMRDSPPPTSLYGLAGPGTLGDAESLHHLEFGDLPVRLGRQTVAGDAGTVLAALRDQCRAQAERGGQTPRAPGPEESRMLQGVAGMVPVAQVPGKWRMYQLDRPVPLVVVTDATGLDAGDDQQPAGRMLSWGLALPAGSGLNEWTLLTYSAVGSATESATNPLAMVLPSGAERQVKLQSQDGGGLLLFAGTGDLETWWSDIEDWFRQCGWVPLTAWERYGAGRHGRYVCPVAGSEAEVFMEFQGQLRGLLTVTRPGRG